MKVIEYWPSLVVTKLGFYMQGLSIMMYALSNSCVFSIIQGKQKLLCGVMSDIILNVSRTFKFTTFLIISWLGISISVSKMQYKANRLLPLLQTAFWYWYKIATLHLVTFLTDLGDRECTTSHIIWYFQLLIFLPILCFIFIAFYLSRYFH